MAQIKFPTEFARQVTLLADIVTKHSKPGFDSPLTGWLAENNIDLAADTQAGNDATLKEEVRARQEAIAKAAYEKRDVLFAAVFAFIRGAAQVLKKYYTTHVATLADWELPVTDGERINYPASFEERTAIATAFFSKLDSFGPGKSPLAAFIAAGNIDTAALATANTDAVAQNNIAVPAAKAAENATEQRNNLWEEPLRHIHLIGDYLKSVYASNPRALGEWGFVVDESVGEDKGRKVKLIIGETKVVDSVRIGSIATNLSKGDVLLYKGKGTLGKMTLLKPNDKMGMVKGYSVITLVNPSTLETATVVIAAPEA